ncbi:MAG: hypothetical protein LH606_00645 [Cytophagaceae bacterium]|nr:hypothetical protein [Cytophagaceae bacterium]
MPLLPEAARYYLTLFKSEADAFFQHWTTLPIRYEFFQRFRERDFLEKAEWPDFQTLRENLHTFSSLSLAGARALGELNHPIEHYRAAFINLLYGKESVAERFDRFKTGIAYFGEGTVSELLQWCFPDQFLNMNDRAVRAVEQAGLKITFPRRSSPGEKIEIFNADVRPLLDAYDELVGLRTTTTVALEFDAFCYWLTENVARLPKPPALPSLPKGIRFWLLAPGRNATEWDSFYENGYAAIGWPDTGDLREFSSISKEEIAERLRKIYGGESDRRNDSLACWQFANEMKPGDVVIAKKGIRYYLGWGIVGPGATDSTKRFLRNLNTAATWRGKAGVFIQKRGERLHRKPLQS